MAFHQSAALQVVDDVVLFRYTLNHIFNAQTFTLYRQEFRCGKQLGIDIEGLQYTGSSETDESPLTILLSQDIVTDKKRRCRVGAKEDSI